MQQSCGVERSERAMSVRNEAAANARRRSELHLVGKHIT
jgi:hypothetical protein